jgi:predicted transcriptional regulator
VSGDLQKPNKSLVNRVIGRLKRDKLVTKDGRDYVLTKPGKSAAKKASGSADKAGEEAA